MAGGRNQEKTVPPDTEVLTLLKNLVEVVKKLTAAVDSNSKGINEFKLGVKLGRI